MAAKKTTRKQATTLRQKPPGGSGWLTGLFIGLLIGGGVVFYLLAMKPTGLLATSPTTVADDKKGADIVEKKKPNGPRFEFYNKLKESSNSTQENNTNKPSTAPTQTPTLSTFDSDADTADTADKSTTPSATTPSASGVLVETHAATPDSKLPGSFLLQAGSFRSNTDADKVRANIILLGLPARVEEIKNDKGETFYRIYVGSFKTVDDMEKAKSTLSANKISTVVVKPK